MKKKCKVIMLPTNEKAMIMMWNEKGQRNELFLRKPDNIHISNIKFQHIYFLSDEEIKVGNWCIDKNNVIYQQTTDKIFDKFTGSKKIIATTDKSLELPQPSPEFIEVFIREYNKGNIITDVMVEYEEWHIAKMPTDFMNHLDITQGLPIISGTERTEIKLKVDKNNCITITKVKDSWSREEVATLCMKIQHETTKYKESCHYGPNTRELAEWTDNWIKENL